jgi:S-formylglutathione hydrolase FrmB
MLALGGLVLAAVAVLFIARALGTDTHGARVIRFTIHSPLVHAALPVTAVVPAGSGGERRPLLVFLHGKGEDESSNLDDAMFSALASLGKRAPDVVFPYGGADSYWHDRAGGAWGSYVVQEVIPQAIRRLHANPRRVAIGGISMGGFGALDIARLNPGRFCAVGGHSASLWPSGAGSAAGAFDDAQDFARHNVIGAAGKGDPYTGTALWIDVGTQDPSRSADTALALDLRRHGHAVQFHVWAGSHDQGYWQSHWASYLRFYAGALAHCHRAEADLPLPLVCGASGIWPDADGSSQQCESHTRGKALERAPLDPLDPRMLGMRLEHGQPDRDHHRRHGSKSPRTDAQPTHAEQREVVKHVTGSPAGL